MYNITLLRSMCKNGMTGLNQVDIFLEQHGGAGIQHIGLYTDNIVKTIHCLQQNGVIFNEPPNTYYTEVFIASECDCITNCVV